jgi:hypothetical protein
MQVEVLGHADGDLVELRCGWGTFRARWDGDQPDIGSTHHVELDIAATLQWGTDITGVEAPAAATDHGGALVCQVAWMSKDGWIGLDVAGDEVAVVTADAPALAIGSWVTVRPGLVKAYPFTL